MINYGSNLVEDFILGRNHKMIELVYMMWNLLYMSLPERVVMYALAQGTDVSDDDITPNMQFWNRAQQSGEGFTLALADKSFISFVLEPDGSFREVEFKRRMNVLIGTGSFYRGDADQAVYIKTAKGKALIPVKSLLSIIVQLSLAQADVTDLWEDWEENQNYFDPLVKMSIVTREGKVKPASSVMSVS